MALITRQGKGYRLTIEELDGNLEYLETLGIKEIYQDGNKVVLERPDNSISEITIDNNLPVVDKKTIGDGEFVTYKGILEYSFEEPTQYIPLKYNINKDTLLDIEFEWGKTYYLSGTISVCLGNSCYYTSVRGYLESNKNYNPNNTFYVNVEEVSVIEIQNDEKIILGGGVRIDDSNQRIIRLNSDSSVDITFNIGDSFDSSVISIQIQSDNKILVGGQFESYNGTTSNYIIRLNSDGSIDESFNIGDGFNDYVFSIQIQSDGKILVGGQFDSYNGTTSNYIIRLNSDGSIDESFNIGDGFNDFVRVIKIQNDGKILVGGWFNEYNGTTSNRIIRLNSDGSIDNTFNIGNGFNNNVRVIQTQSDGKLLVGGAFSSYNGTSSNRLIRLNSDGSRDNTFNIGTGFDNNIRVIQVQSDGKILVGGAFEIFNGDETKVYFLRLNSNGSIDTSFNIVADDVGDNYVQAIAIHPDGNILASGWGGLFRFSFDGTPTSGVPIVNEPIIGSLRILNEKLHIILGDSSDSGVLQFEIIETNFKK